MSMFAHGEIYCYSNKRSEKGYINCQWPQLTQFKNNKYKKLSDNRVSGNCFLNPPRFLKDTKKRRTMKVYMPILMILKMLEIKTLKILYYHINRGTGV
jgi:hypothetical protein